MIMFNPVVYQWTYKGVSVRIKRHDAGGYKVVVRTDVNNVLFDVNNVLFTRYYSIRVGKKRDTALTLKQAYKRAHAFAKEKSDES